MSATVLKVMAVLLALSGLFVLFGGGVTGLEESTSTPLASSLIVLSLVATFFGRASHRH